MAVSNMRDGLLRSTALLTTVAPAPLGDGVLGLGRAASGPLWRLIPGAWRPFEAGPALCSDGEFRFLGEIPLEELG